MESSAHTAPVHSETIKKNRVAALSEIITENVSRGDHWIRQRTQPLLTHKQSRKTETLTTEKSSQKLFPEMTEGILSSHSTC
jgi:hypothetical protein